jgi:hypothetical protein
MTRLILLVAVVLGVSVAPASATVYFDFHRYSNTGSVLYETWQDPSTGRVYAQQSWRAGSGVSGDECQVNAGWLPGGYYSVIAHYDHFDGTIKGRVWYLGEKQCYNGTWRKDLFIHSEETAANGQLCGSPYYDERYCWDGDGDYKSLGCIKISRGGATPTDLGQADGDWHGWGGTAGSYRVYVY